MTIEEIKTVCFVGAGTMGCVNSLVAAIAGYNVVLYDVSEDNLKQAPEKHKEISVFLIGNGHCTSEAVPEALKRISITPNLEKAAANADLVSESVYERLDLKRQIHQKLDELCPPRTILTTNTSAILVSDIESAVLRRDLFAALHSYLGSPLIDIVGGSQTKAATIDILKRYVLSLGGVPLVLKKEYPGYVVNALIGPLLTTAMLLVIGGFAGKEEVDRAWMYYRKAPMGPFGMMDLFGLNVISDSWQRETADAHHNKLKAKIVPFVQRFLEKGELGMKTGKGFYTYPDPAYQQPEFFDDTPDVSVAYQALISSLIQSAGLIAANGVADPADIDRAWMTATYLDIGPFGVLDQMGMDNLLDMYREIPMELSVISSENAGFIEAFLKQHNDHKEPDQ